MIFLNRPPPTHTRLWLPLARNNRKTKKETHFSSGICSTVHARGFAPLYCMYSVPEAVAILQLPLKVAEAGNVGVLGWGGGLVGGGGAGPPPRPLSGGKHSRPGGGGRGRGSDWAAGALTPAVVVVQLAAGWCPESNKT